MSAELAALQALWSLGRHPETARLVLDETGTRADDCADEEWRTVFATIEERIRSLRPLDLVTLMQSLAEKVDPSKLLALEDFVPPGCERERLEQLRDVASRRRCIEAMRAVAVRLKEGQDLASIEADLRALPALVAGAKPRVRSATGDSMRILDSAEEAWKAKQSPTLKTGWEQLDAVWRLIPNLHAVGAQGGVGKTAFVAGLVRGWTHNSITVGVLAYEDDGLELQRRILAAEAELELSVVYGERLMDEAESGRWEEGHKVRTSAERFLLIDDAHPRGSVSDVCASLRAMRAKGARVGILDNLSCVAMDAREERHQAVEDALLQVRETAVELRMPVIVVGHLKRSVGTTDEATTEPRLSDFAGSAGWERYARSCLGMWRGPNGPRLGILKQNQGKVGGKFDAVLRESAACVVDVLAVLEQPDAGERRTHGRR